MKKTIRKFKKRWIFFALLIIVIVLGVFNSYKSLPNGISYTGEIIKVSEQEIDFLYDLTYEAEEKRIYDHEIFDKILETIDSAEKYVLIDMFLWSKGNEEPMRDLAQEMTDHLIKRKKEIPELKVIVITDLYNTGYGSFDVDYFEQMKDVEIDVVFTDLNKLRDSNLLYSPLWRTFFQILGDPSGGWVQIPGYSEKGSIRAFLKLMNFKANHRKTMIADCGNQMCSFVISANPAGSGAEHSNVGFLVKNNIYQDIYNSEKTVLNMSGYKFDDWDFSFVKANLEETKDIEIQLLTEKKIKDNILMKINESQKDEEIKIAIFYFSDREIIRALLKASERGVDIKIIADPSKTGFGRDKFGVPTRMVISELIKKSNGKIKAKYYDTDAEQFHTKMSIFSNQNNLTVILGSGNYTRRNLDNLNLEADLKVKIPIDKNMSLEILEYFEKMWNNNGGHYTIDSNSFTQPSLWRTIQYRFQEFSGASTF